MGQGLLRLAAVAALLLLVLGAVASALECQADEMMCIMEEEESCVEHDWICDDFPDCDEGEDEDPAICKTSGADIATVVATTTTTTTTAAPYRYDDDYDYYDYDPNDDDGHDDHGGGDESVEQEEEVVEVQQAPPAPPEPPQMCSLQQCDSRQQFAYETGKVYYHRYAVEASTQVLGTSEKEANFRIQADVNIAVLTRCEMELKISAVEMIASKSDGGESRVTDHEFLTNLKSNNLRFSLNNGLVDTVCPRSNETLESLNFKRGLVALLQNTMPRFDLEHHTRESDVLGTCDVAYKFDSTNSTKFVIEKVKDLDSCTNKMSVSSSVKSVPYAFIGGLQSAPVLSSTSRCEQSVSSRRVQSVECEEEYRLTPFSSEAGGVVTVVTQALTLTYTSFINPKRGSIPRRTGIEYEHYDAFDDQPKDRADETLPEEDSEEEEEETAAKINKVKSVLETIAVHLRETGSSVARPHDFSALVTSMRQLSDSQLIQLAEEEGRDKNKSWLVLQDALSSVGTSASVSLIRHLLSSQPNHDKGQQWLQSLAYIPRPDLPTLSTAVELLSIPSIPSQAFLGVGALVGAYCHHNPGCQTHEPVRQNMAVLHNFLLRSCVRNTSPEKIQTLMAIKGVGNAGRAATEETVSLLQQCYTETSNENEIRVAAVNAFRHFQCNLTEPLETILKDQEEDSEVRISAYLGIMRCADYDTLALVQSLLEEEEVNQVGSFVWSHLRNLQEGALPSHATLQGLLSNVRLVRKFSTDARKFSRNYEWSAFYDPLNIGGSVEGNLIFSQRSYIPRSSSLNFTTDLFGQSINWLELEARVEGLERPIENLFMGGVPPPGPASGGIRDVNVRTLIDSTGTGRAYRSKQPEVSLSMRTFGNDVYYQHLHGSKKILNSFTKLDPREYIKRLNRGETLSVQKSSRAVESSGRVATSAGLPVTVAVTGTVSMDVSVKANIKFGSILPSSFDPSIDIRGTLTPSVSSDLVASVSIDGVAAMAGVEVEASLSSSSTLEGRVACRGLTAFNLDLSVPSDRMEIVNVTSRLLLLHGHPTPEEESKDLTVEREVLESTGGHAMAAGDCTLYADQTGAQVCWQTLYPNTSSVGATSPQFPLTGSAKLVLLLVRTDPQLRNYQLRYNLVRSSEESSLLISANTPGTSMDREHSLMVSINTRQQTASFRAHTPTVHYDAMGRYQWTAAVKRLDLAINRDSVLTSEVELSLVSHEKIGKSLYKPTAKIKWQGTDIFSLGGDIEAHEKIGSSVYKLDLEFSVNTVGSNRPSQVSGTVRGELKTDHTEQDISLVVDYNILDQPHDIRVTYNMENASENSDWKFVSNCRVVFSQFPTLNFLWNNSYRMKPGSGEMDIMFSFGVPYEDPANAVHFHRSLTFLHTDDRTFVNSTLALRNEMNNIDIKISGDIATDWSHVVSTGFIYQIWPDRAFSSRLVLQKTTSHLLDGSGNFELKIPSWPDVFLRATVNETSRRQYDLYTYGTAGSERSVEVRGTYHSDPLLGHKLLLDVTLPDRGTTNVNATALFTWKDAYVVVEVTPESGAIYRGLVKFTHTLGQHGSSSTRSLHVEAHTPSKIIKSSTVMSVGTVVTITNRLQIDRSQDILTWLTMDILKEKERGIQFKVQWDPNRDPNKKIEFGVSQDWSDPNVRSLEASAFLGMFDHTYEMTWTSSTLKKHERQSLEWEQSHRGSLVWEEDYSGHRQEVVASAVVRFTKAATADLTATLQLTTPFHQWFDNHIKISYSRDDDHLKGSVESRWHDREFLTADLLMEKSYLSLGDFTAKSSLDISSSFRGMASLSTGAMIVKAPGHLESNAFIQWEEDRIELMLEGYDRSVPEQLEYSLFTQAITSLEGYRSLKGELNLLASAKNVNAKAEAKWDALSYGIKCRGNRFTGYDYLDGEVFLWLPGYQRDDFHGQLRVFEDPEDNKHKLLALGKWKGKELKIEGHVTSDRQDFHGSLSIDTPFQALPRASLVLGKGYDGVNHKSEARFVWGPNFNAGFEMKAHLTSLSDFLVSVTIDTPFERFREVRAEVLNLFQVHDNVQCHSRIFGQIGDKRYGIGGRYEQGLNPRIRVAFEIYTPLPNLELLSLDLRDNSENHDSEYDLMVLYGSNRPLQLTVVVVRGEDEEDWAVVASLPFSILNTELHDAKLDVKTGLGWGRVPRLTLALHADTGTERTLYLNGRLPPNELGTLEATLGGVITVPGYEEIAVKADFLEPGHEEEGIFDASFRTLGAGTITVNMKGGYRSFKADFTSPVEPFRIGELEWQMVRLDVVRETVTGVFKWETGEMKLDGTAHINDGIISRLEAVVETPWAALRTADVTLDNTADEDGGFTSHIQVTGEDMSYIANIVKNNQHQHDWNLKVELERTSGSISSEYTSDVTYRFDQDKLLLAVDVTTPHEGYKLLSGKIDIDFQFPSYVSLITWDTPIGAGRLQTDMERDTLSRSIVWTSTLTRQHPAHDPSTYKLKVTLDNRSSREEVDLDMGVTLTSNHQDWGMIQVEGSMKQVTSEPGQMRLSLTWPNLSPVTFIGEISHQEGYSIIRPTVTLEIDKTRYIVNGEMRKVGNAQLILRGMAVMNTEGQRPVQVEIESDFTYPANKVDGTITLRLPLADPWDTSEAKIAYQNIDGDHKFNVRMLTGGEVTMVEGSISSPAPGEVEGSISLESTLKWNNHPLKLSFRQSLTEESYTGEYTLDFPRHSQKTDTWTRGVVKASLRHSFLAAGQKGYLTLHPAFVNLQPIRIDYNFEFPGNQDMTVEVRISYKGIAAGLKVEEITVHIPGGEYKNRFTVEFDNPLWPFGVSNYKTSTPDGKHNTLIEVYDLMRPDRKISLSISSSKEDQGRMVAIKTVLPAGREVSLTTGYHFSSTKVDLHFNFKWLEDQHIDVGFKWEDLSQMSEKKHRLEARFSHPFRAVVLAANYRRLGATVDADLNFDWDKHNPQSDVLQSRLQWQDLSYSTGQHYKGLLTVVHPSLPRDIVTNVELQRGQTHPLLAAVTVQYSPDTAQDLSLNLNITRLTHQQQPRQHFLSKLGVLHPHSNLQLAGTSTLIMGDGLYSYEQILSYSNATGHSYESRVDAALDLAQKTLRAKVTGNGKELDVRLLVVEESAGRWRIVALSSPEEEFPISSLVELHPHQSVVTVTVYNTAAGREGGGTNQYPNMRVKKVSVRGGVEDMRNAIFSLSHIETLLEDPELMQEEDQDSFHQYGQDTSSEDITTTSPAPPQNLSEILVADIDFSFRLNHTRLLTSRLMWRPTFREELGMELSELAGLGRVYRSSVREWLLEVVKHVGAEAVTRARPIARDMAATATPLIAHFKNQSVEFVVDLRKVYTTLSLTHEEMQLRDSLNFIFRKFAKSFKETRIFKWLQAKLAGGTLRAKIVAFIDRIKSVYRNAFSGSGEGLRVKLQRFKTALAETHDKLVKRWYLKLSQVLSDFRARIRGWLRERWHAVYHNYKPHIISTINNIELALNQMVATVSGWGRDVRQSIASSKYYQFISQRVNQVKEFVNSVLRRSLKENLEVAFDWVESMLGEAWRFFLREVAPFLKDILDGVMEAITIIEQYPVVAQIKTRVVAIVETVIWSVRQLNLREQFIDTVAFVVENGYTIVTQTALQAEHRQRKEKTSLFLDTDAGLMQFTQKLPMDWYYFNQKPNWEELQEWRYFKLVKGVLTGGRTVNVLGYWYKYFNLRPDPSSWLPPFQGTSQVVGQQHLVSWNGRLLEFKGVCRYLLAADLVSKRWAVVLNYHANAPNAYLIYIGGKQIEMEQDFTVKIDGQPSKLPLVQPTFVVYRSSRSGEELILQQDSGLTIRWNQLHDVFSITVHGIYFGKVGGLLGSNNYEHLDDLLTPVGYRENNTGVLADTWSVSRSGCQTELNNAVTVTGPNSDRCTQLFHGKESPFRYCFYQVSPTAYESMCNSVASRSSAEQRKTASCSAASAFRHTCDVAGVPTKIPHDCSACKFESADGTERIVPESQTTVIPLAQIPQSTDIVLIIEAGACNSVRNLRRNLPRFYETFDAELSRSGLRDARYAVVSYGGKDFFAAPQLVLDGKELFVAAGGLGSLLNSIEFDTPSLQHPEDSEDREPVDAFEALRFATNLPFRAGVTPTFLMMPCSPCLPSVGWLDFSTMYHILVDRSVTLHVLTPADLIVSKPSVANKIFGMDSTTVYTVRDSTAPSLRGDEALRRQVADPRTQLEYCSPLALQTEGTIFSSKYLNLRRRKKVEQLAVVLSRRVAVTATPRYGQRCICLPTSGDSVRMKCHRQRPEWGNYSPMAPYFDEEEEDDYIDGYEALSGV